MVDILFLISRRTWVSIEDICSLCVPNIKYARRVMRRLIENRLVNHVRCQLFIDRKGPGLNFYSLSKLGAKTIGIERYNEPQTPTSTSLLHYYGISTLISAFQYFSNCSTDCKTKYLTAKELQIENAFQTYFYECRDSETTENFIIPDFVIGFSSGCFSKLILGEVDTGTESIYSKTDNARSIENKFRSVAAYQRLQIHNFFCEILESDFDTFTYLHITNGGPERISKLVNACKSVTGIDNIRIAPVNSILPTRAVEKGKLKISYEEIFKPVWIDPLTGTSTTMMN